MKSKFAHYHRPSDEWFNELWESCTFIVDANVILNLYRYSPQTSEQLFNTLNIVKERIWMPYQAALEYQQNRLEVISTETKTYSDTIRQSKNLRESLKSSRRHPFAKETLIASTLDLLQKLENDLQKTQDKRDKLFSHDPQQNRIAELFADRVGDPLSEEKESLVVSEGEKRYKKKIPPGYKDIDKEGDRKYSDLRIWFQILDEAQASQRNVVFITDDAKEDWWLIHSGKVISPRPELVEEITKRAGVMFYMYQPSRFMEHAQKFLKQDVKRETIDEIKSVSSYLSNENTRTLQDELTEKISSRYKAFKRFVENYNDIEWILSLYVEHDFVAHDVDNDPFSLPKELLDALELIVRSNPEAVTAVQAIHSLSSGILERQAKQLGVSGKMLSNAYLTNSLPGAFIRLLTVIRDVTKLRFDPRSELEVILRQYYGLEKDDSSRT